jgi:hypothetical protein
MLIAYTSLIFVSKISGLCRAAVGLICLLILSPFAAGDTEYYRHILFDNSLESDAYYYSTGKASAPSTLELEHGKLPVSKTVFYTPPNALRLKWRSAADGACQAWKAGGSAGGKQVPLPPFGMTILFCF